MHAVSSSSKGLEPIREIDCESFKQVDVALGVIKQDTFDLSSIQEQAESLNGRIKEFNQLLRELEPTQVSAADSVSTSIAQSSEKDPLKMVTAVLKTILIWSVVALGVVGCLAAIGSGVGAWAAPLIAVGTLFAYGALVKYLAPETLSEVKSDLSPVNVTKLLIAGPIFDAMHVEPSPIPETLEIANDGYIASTAPQRQQIQGEIDVFKNVLEAKKSVLSDRQYTLQHMRIDRFAYDAVQQEDRANAKITKIGAALNIINGYLNN